MNSVQPKKIRYPLLGMCTSSSALQVSALFGKGLNKNLESLKGFAVTPSPQENTVLHVFHAATSQEQVSFVHSSVSPMNKAVNCSKYAGSGFKELVKSCSNF